MSTGRPGFRDKCVCGHLGIHHHYEKPYPCFAKSCDCPCNEFEGMPE